MARKESADEIARKVRTKMGELNSRYTRMDADFEIWDMQETSNTIDYDQSKLPAVSSTKRENDIHVISNDLRTFADQVQSTLSSADMQINVRMAEEEGKDKRDDIGKLERLLYFALDMADRRLRKQLLPTLRDSVAWFSPMTGWIAARVLVYKAKSGDVIFDILPQDPRWLSFDTGSEGLLWTGYQRFRSGASLKDEWSFTEGVKEKDNEIIDYWRQDGDRDFTNVVLSNGILIRERGFKMRSFPEIIVPVATRPPLALSSYSSNTDDMEEGYGDSIFAPLRNINKTWNRIASIVATHANVMSKQPLLNYKDEYGVELTSTVYLAEYVKNLSLEHNKVEAAPMKEIPQTVVGLLDMLSRQKDKGTLPQVPVGSPPPSGTLYNLVQEQGNKIFNPQIKNLSYFYEEVCRLIEEQLIDDNIKVEVKREEKRKYFETSVTPVDLKKPHITRVEFTAKTPWTQMDTAQVAQMLIAIGLPKTWVWEHILKIDDIRLIRRLIALEAYEYSPEGIMREAVNVLVEMGYEFEAVKLVEKMDLMNAQEMGGGVPPQPPVARGGER